MLESGAETRTESKGFDLECVHYQAQGPLLCSSVPHTAERWSVGITLGLETSPPRETHAEGLHCQPLVQSHGTRDCPQSDLALNPPFSASYSPLLEWHCHFPCLPGRIVHFYESLNSGYISTKCASSLNPCPGF